MPHPPCLLRCYHANKWHVKTTLFLFLHLFFYLLFLQEFNFGAVWCFCIHYSAFCCSSSQKGWHHNATLMQNHKTTWNEQTTTAYNGTHLRPKPCPIPWIDTGERSWPGVNHVLFLCYFIFALNVNFPPPLKAAYGPGQPTSLVFATPPPQMNSAPQPRQVRVCLMSSFASSVIHGVPFPHSHSHNTPQALSLSFALVNISKTCCLGFGWMSLCLLVFHFNVHLDFFPVSCSPSSLLQVLVLYTNRY